MHTDEHGFGKGKFDRFETEKLRSQRGAEKLEPVKEFVH
jgi:hypothetical protein